ncbi:MAG: TlpA family protein disulfide reductase, partial [Bacteroidales bacterium]
KRELTIPKFYLLKLDQQNFITLLINPGEKITVTADADSLAESYEVAGSPDSKLIQEYNNYLYENILKLNELNKIYTDSLDSPNIADIISSLDERSSQILEDQKNYTIRYITENNRSMVSLLALYQQISPRNYILTPLEDIKYFEMVDSTLYGLYPESEPVQALHAQVIELKKRIEVERIKEMQFAIGAFPPEIALPGPDGDTITLSSTLGNVVLLDFWAAWCNPCRQENPNLVESYKTYHSKGFEIFQVSLDRNRDAWLGAIESDNLGQWIHVSDLKFWNSIVVELYKLEQIPANFLLDREGKIIARDLRGENLGKKLSELFD